MLTATLLDPRLSAYQSELGKAFYQVRAFDKALATWDYAAGLDPKDPTPHFYKGIALTDLNRPGEAVQAINRSIALNDNRAVFRSRLLLDRDQSTRNYNLARAYSQLGLGEWALSKATHRGEVGPLKRLAPPLPGQGLRGLQPAGGGRQHGGSALPGAVPGHPDHLPVYPGKRLHLHV
jgi:tetratricopeptide (TPR) repeat protein